MGASRSSLRARPSPLFSPASGSRPARRSWSETASPWSAPATRRSSSRMQTGSSSPGPLLADRQLYLVTPVRPGFGEFLAAAIRGGVDVVQVRDRSLADGRLLDALGEARIVTAAHGIPLGRQRPARSRRPRGSRFRPRGAGRHPRRGCAGLRPAGRPLHPRACRDRRGEGRLHRRRSRARDADEGRPARGRPRARPLCRRDCDSPLVRHRRHRRRQTSRTSLRPERPGSRSSGQSSRRTTRSEPPGSSARRFPTSRAGGSWRP